MAAAEPGAVPAQGTVIPRATYRLQLKRTFTLRDATALVPYFDALGISHLYCSPYTRARPGSEHGYDVVDHNSINPEIGTQADLDRFVATLRAHGMGHILDLVPNHVGVMGAENAWWMDVLENGQASIYAQFFDIDWQSVDPVVSGKVLVPVLGDRYGSVLERGELVLTFEREAGALAVYYHEHRFPLDPRDYPVILERALALLPRERLSEELRDEFSSLITGFGHLPDRRQPAPAAIEERHRDKEVHKRRLTRLCARSEGALPEAIEAAVLAFNGVAGDSASFDALHTLLESQAYRLAYWRVAADEINYRRFFDVNDLAALRMENESVFEATHRLVLELVAAGKVDGLRIDHPDGLYDPAQYFWRLQRHVARERDAASARRELGSSTPGTATAARFQELPLYLVVEKINAPFEHLREDWPVHGTTGYRFANVVNGLLVDRSAKGRLDRAYHGFIGAPLVWADVAYECKLFIVQTSLAAELNVLASELARIARAARDTRDFTHNSLRRALAEVTACFPVYRTYVAAGVSAEDRRYIDWALAYARRRGSSTDAAVYDFVGAILLREGPGAAVADAARAFAMKFQQLTAPAAAKGVEDTAFYRFNRLTSLNEVGGEPDSFGISVRAFHADAQYRARHWPHELLASSTHDTKRSEDVRARIDVLSEMPATWRRALRRWRQMNRARKRIVDELPAPVPNDEYLLYQTLLGTLPLGADATCVTPEYVQRIEAYMQKAVRESKMRSSWSSINGLYEDALRQFIRDVLEARPSNLFLAELTELARVMAHFGLLNALTQTLCKLTAPGVPDTYQGTETWDFSLVDPDNRRPVDYPHLSALLAAIKAAANAPQAIGAYARSLLDSLPDGRAKLYLTWRALELRRARPELFAYGSYTALTVSGPQAQHLCAFARRHGTEVAVTVVPRLYARLLNAAAELPLGAHLWQDTCIELPEDLDAGMLTNVFDEAHVPVRELAGHRALAAAAVLESFPVGLLANPRPREAPA